MSIRVTYWSSACVTIATPDVSVLCDPWLEGPAFAGSWYPWPPPPSPAEMVERIGKVDLIWLSHLHPDHTCIPFLRRYLGRYPDAEVIIAPWKHNYLERMLTVEGIPHRVAEHWDVRGPTEIKLVPYSTDVYEIDSALIVRRMDHSVVNMNDCPYSQEHHGHIRHLLAGYDATVALIGYAATGPWPATHDYDAVTMAQHAEAKKQVMFERYRQHQRALNPVVTIPFAGGYVYGGWLYDRTGKNGMADATEVLAFDKTAVVLESGATIDTETLTPTKVRTTPYDPVAMLRYASGLRGQWTPYERWFGNLDVKAIPWARLLPKAYENAQRHNAYAQDYYIALDLREAECGWWVMNARQVPNAMMTCGFVYDTEVKKYEPRYELTLPLRALFGALVGIPDLHMNTLIGGAHYTARRVPDVWIPEAERFLDHFCAL